MQKKRKVSEAEEKDEQRFAFKILKAPFTSGIKGLLCIWTGITHIEVQE